LIANDPIQDLSELLDIHEAAILGKIHTGIIARVTSFDSSGSVDVQPLYRMEFEDGENIQFPEIPNVPICYPVSGTFEITFPLEVGDSVFLSFSERSLDEWKSNNSTDYRPAAKRKFDLSDAVAIPIMRAGSRGGIDAMTIGNRNGANIRITENKISFSNSTTEILSEIIALLEALTLPANIITPAGAGSFNGPTLTSLETIKTNLKTFQE
jgi:hypothetical protein